MSAGKNRILRPTEGLNKKSHTTGHWSNAKAYQGLGSVNLTLSTPTHRQAKVELCEFFDMIENTIVSYGSLQVGRVCVIVIF